MLQNLEKIALGVTLVIIVALLAGFAFYDVNTLKGPGIQLPKLPDHNWWQILTIVGGTLIVVQGFETSRYLDEEFDTDSFRVSNAQKKHLLILLSNSHAGVSLRF